MEHPSSGTNHLSSPPYTQPYPSVQQPYGREQDYSGYPQKMSDPYYSSQRSGATTPIYPTPLPALIEPGQNYSPRGLDGPKLGGQQFGMTSPGYGQGSSEMGPMMRALTEDDVFMPQQSEYRSPMQSVGPSYGQSMGYTSPDATRGAYGAGQYPSPFSPGHSPRTSQIYPVRSHPMSPHDSGFGTNAPQYHRQTSQSPHMNMVSPTSQNSVFNRGAGVTAPSPVVMQGPSMYSHSPGSSQGGRGNTHFPFSTSPVSQHTSPLPSPSSLRSPGVVHSPHNLATASPGPFNTPSNPSPVNVPRPIKSPLAAFQTPAAVTQSGHPLMSPKVRPVNNGEHNSSTPYVELVHTRNDASNKGHLATSRGSPENPYPKKKEDRCSSGHLPKLEEMVAFLGESATKGILTANDDEKSVENDDNSSKVPAKVESHSEEPTVKSNGERLPQYSVIHSGSVEAAERQMDISNAKKKITVQENNRCAPANGSPRPSSKSPRTDRGSHDGSPKSHKANGDVNERSPLPGQLSRSPRGSSGMKETTSDNQNGPVKDALPPKVTMNNSLDLDRRGTQSPQNYKVANDISQVDKNSMSVNNQLKRKFSETQNDVYHNNTFNNFPRNGGQSVTAYPLTYTPTNGNSSKELNQYHPSSPRGSKSPARKSTGDFADGSPRKVLRTYSGKKKRISVDKQGNAIVLPSPLLPLSMTDPPKPKEEKQSSPDEPAPTNQVIKEEQDSGAQTSTAKTTVPRSSTPPFQNPMTTPSSQRSTPEKPSTPNSQKGPPGTPTSQAVSDDPSTPTPGKKRGRPLGSKNRPREEGEAPKPKKKPTKKNPDVSVQVKDALGKFKHLKASTKSRRSDSPALLQARARGPILRITGTRADPVSSKIVNNPDVLAISTPAPSHKKHGSKRSKASSKQSQSVSRAPLGPATKQSLTVNNPTGQWLCALCGKPANHDSLGDLYGPYYPPGYQIPILHPQSTPEKAKSAVAAAASKKQQQHARTNQKGKLKAKISPPPKVARTSKVLPKGKASRSTSAQRQRKYSDEADYFSFLEEATTSSGRVSKTPRRMSFDIPKVASSRGGHRRRKSGDLEDKGPCDPNEYWVHEDCVIWTHGVYVVGGTLYGLAESIKVTHSVGCFECKNKGASLGCMSKGCKKTYHYVCALQAECQLQVDNYSMICPQHKDKVVKMKDLT